MTFMTFVTYQARDILKWSGAGPSKAGPGRAGWDRAGRGTNCREMRPFDIILKASDGAGPAHFESIFSLVNLGHSGKTFPFITACAFSSSSY